MACSDTIPRITITAVLLIALLLLPNAPGFATDEDGATPEDERPTRSFGFWAGYNAFQAGVTNEGQFRSRMYTNLGLSFGKVYIKHHGMNQGGDEYYFGRNTVRIGHDDFPWFDILFATRIGGSGIGDARRIDEGFGVRINLSWFPGLDYGFVDAVKHNGDGLSAYAGSEAFFFLGKRGRLVTIEATAWLKEAGRRYIEVEFLSTTVGLKGCDLRGYARFEFPGMSMNERSAIVGVQFQLKR